MDSGGYSLRWDDTSRGQNGGIISEEIISDMDTVQSHYSIDPNSHLNNEVIIPDTHQIAAENLIFLAHDLVGHYDESGQPFDRDAYTLEEQVVIDNTGEIECQVTEEVITDDWVQPGGQERVEVPLEQLAMPNIEQQHEGNDVDVPLPTDQDQYTAMRPYPCDFCSRRFRKKANLMNHMVAHQNDRPFGCNLCGARYVRRCDLLNHLKVHAFVPEDAEDDILSEVIPKRKSRKRSAQYSYEDKSSTQNDKTAVAARTQQYEGSGSGSANLTYNRIIYEATDPSRPFVCQHCGVGFAREKALASHSRVHGGDSPIECNICGELCFSRDNLISHTHSRHPHKTPQALPIYDEEEASSEDSVANEEDDRNDSWVELICKDCGAGFQRADLLQKHVRAAHNYLYTKKESESDNKTIPEEDAGNLEEETWGSNHACSVCGEGFKDALDLLAHAESHARGRNNRCVSCGEKFTDNSMMAEHIATAHPDLPPHTCLFCGRTCNDERGLAKHIASQHDSPGKMLFCSKCGKSFHSKARLKRHMASHRDKAVTCDVCGDSFADGRSLMNHRHSHKTNSGRKFPCHECGKTFGSRSSQQIHIRIHTGERPYGCRFCWKAFADGGTLRKHERIHTGEKPYACAICPRAFNQRVVLREHVRSHHSGPNLHHGNEATPYWCPVCDRLMAASVELVHHIIQHCDNNTAMKRQPQAGPRKYKRRRKNLSSDLKLSPSNTKNDSDGSASETEIVNIPIKKFNTPRKSKADKSPVFQMDDNSDVSTQNISNRSGESSVGGSARTKGKLKTKRSVEVLRPKMIHTQKTKPEDAMVTRRKGRNNVSIITSTTTATTSSNSEDRIRPRTKNVTYHDGIERLPAATFPSSVKAEPENDIAADIRAIFKNPLSIDLDENSSQQTENIKCEMNDDSRLEVELPYIKEESEEGMNSSDDGPFRCEMCSEAFELREQLLKHVRVHI